LIYKQFIILIVLTLSLSGTNRSDFKVAIDIGHTKNNQGATSARGVGEYIYNENIANMILLELHHQGFINSFIIKKKTPLTLRGRTLFAKKHEADIFISIHHDSVKERYLSYWIFNNQKHHYSDKFNGYSLFISNKNKNKNESIRLGSSIGYLLQKNKFKHTLHHAEKIKGESKEFINRSIGLYAFDNLIVLRTAEMPALLIECGVIVNREEEVKLSKKNYKSKLVESIVDGIVIFFSELDIGNF